MACIQTLLHWYNTVATTDSLTRSQDTALFAIASVSAVVWTGGLISGQIKQWNVVLPVSLDLVQCAFMGAVFKIFVPALGFRYLATAFLLYYIAASSIGIWRNRNTNWAKAKLGSKLTMLNDEQWNAIAKTNRLYSIITLASVSLFVLAIVWPYPIAVCWLRITGRVSTNHLLFRRRAR